MHIKEKIKRIYKIFNKGILALLVYRCVLFISQFLTLISCIWSFLLFVEYAEMPQVFVTGFVFVCLTVLIHRDTGRETASKLHTENKHENMRTSH